MTTFFGAAGLEGVPQLVGVADLGPVDLEDHVALLHAALLGDALVDHLGDGHLVELHAERPAVAIPAAAGGAELLAREQVVEVGDPVGPQRHDQRRVHLVLGDGRVVGVELGVVGVLVVGLARPLAPEEARHVRREERGVVAAAAPQARRPSRTSNGIRRVELLDRGEDLLEVAQHRLGPADAREVVRPAVVHQHGRDLGHQVRVRLDVGGRAEQALLLAAPEHEPDRPLRLARPPSSGCGRPRASWRRRCRCRSRRWRRPTSRCGRRRSRTRRACRSRGCRRSRCTA